jgi:hypothetical protein
VRSLAAVAAAILVLVILVATLTPAAPPGSDAAVWCGLQVVCGSRGLADALANLLLFVPLGMALRVAADRRLGAVLAVVVFSMGIETVQAWVPGRFPSVGDVLFNGLGGAVGVLLASRGPGWLRGPRRLRLGILSGYLALALAAVAATGILLEPATDVSAYFVQWTPDLPDRPAHAGRVTGTWMEGRRLDPGLHRGDPSLSGLMEGEALEVHFLAAPGAGGSSPVVRILDRRGGELLDLGVHEHDLVLRVRRRAEQAGLVAPAIRVPGALAGVTRGEAVSVRSWRQRGGPFCVAWSASSGGRTVCGLGSGAGSGWALLVSSDLPDAFVAGMDAGWMALLILPAGLLVASIPEVVGLGVLVVGALHVLPAWVGLLPTSPLEVAGALVGLLLGVVAGAVVRRRPGLQMARRSSRDVCPASTS